MLMDLHFHTELFSRDSRMSLEAGLKQARAMGLDGVCITEHDVLAQYANLDEIAARYGLVVLTGVEILTLDGDILCFGLDQVPEVKIDADTLTSLLDTMGGATVAAHPYRDNNRGVKDALFELSHLTAVEGYNGNTSAGDNLRAVRSARELALPVTGASDAHSVDRVGMFATRFAEPVYTMDDLIAALRGGQYNPVRYSATERAYFDL